MYALPSLSLVLFISLCLDKDERGRGEILVVRIRPRISERNRIDRLREICHSFRKMPRSSISKILRLLITFHLRATDFVKLTLRESRFSLFFFSKKEKLNFHAELIIDIQRDIFRWKYFNNVLRIFVARWSGYSDRSPYLRQHVIRIGWRIN